MKRKAYFCLAWILLSVIVVTSSAIAQQVEISSSANPVGSGARAMGMGGAFIAVADDATAASWNPGGLIQLETPEVSAVFSYHKRREEYTSQTHPETEGGNEMSSSNLNYLSAAYPFALAGRNMVVSLNYQHLYDFTKDIEFDYNYPLAGTTMKGHWNFQQEGGLYTVSPAFAVQITPRFSAGMTVNFWENPFGNNGWEDKSRYTASGTRNNIPIDVQWRENKEHEFSGYNMHLGFLWSINETFTLGGVYKTPFTADINKKRSLYYEVQAFNSFTDTVETEDMELKMPDSYGLGLAVRLSDSLTVNLDVYRTEWGKYTFVDSSGNETSPVTGMPKSDTEVKPTHQIRLGGEYLFIRENTVIPVRAGIFYDPEPSEGNPEDYYGVSLGSGFMWGNMVLDAAYQYRWGNDVEGDVIGVPNTSADVSQHLALVSAIYHF